MDRSGAGQSGRAEDEQHSVASLRMDRRVRDASGAEPMLRRRLRVHLPVPRRLDGGPSAASVGPAERLEIVANVSTGDQNHQPIGGQVARIAGKNGQSAAAQRPRPARNKKQSPPRTGNHSFIHSFYCVLLLCRSSSNRYRIPTPRRNPLTFVAH